MSINENPSLQIDRGFEGFENKLQTPAKPSPELIQVALEEWEQRGVDLVKIKENLSKEGMVFTQESLYEIISDLEQNYDKMVQYIRDVEFDITVDEAVDFVLLSGMFHKMDDGYYLAHIANKNIYTAVLSCFPWQDEQEKQIFIQKNDIKDFELQEYQERQKELEQLKKEISQQQEKDEV